MHPFATNHDVWLRLAAVNDNQDSPDRLARAPLFPVFIKSEVSCHTPRCMGSLGPRCRAIIFQLPCLWQLPR